jgi:hypothetical protein
MKLIYCITASLLFVCAGITASPTPALGKSPGHKPPTKKVDESDKPPFVGMTKTQALARYGSPNSKTSTENGEQWTYVLNMGQFIGKHMIPFFFSTQRLRTGVLIFGPDGRVKNFRWDTPEG